MLRILAISILSTGSLLFGSVRLDVKDGARVPRVAVYDAVHTAGLDAPHYSPHILEIDNNLGSDFLISGQRLCSILAVCLARGDEGQQACIPSKDTP